MCKCRFIHWADVRYSLFISLKYNKEVGECCWMKCSCVLLVSPVITVQFKKLWKYLSIETLICLLYHIFNKIRVWQFNNVINTGRFINCWSLDRLYKPTKFQWYFIFCKPMKIIIETVAFDFVYLVHIS